MSNIFLDCFVPTNDEFCKLVNFSMFEKSIFSSWSRNDGDLYRHHSFLQGVYPMPAARNDGMVIPAFHR